MLNYLQYKKGLKKTLQFEVLLKEFCTLEDEERKHSSWTLGVNHTEEQLLLQKRCVKKYPEKYLDLRKKITQEMLTIRQIAWLVGIGTVRQSCPPPSPGGPIIPVDIFESILEDHGYSPTGNITRFDYINKLIGKLTKAKSDAFKQIFNPLSWLSFILKIPFLILKQTGFNVDKIEDALWGKLFKLVFLLFLVYGLLKLGFSHDQIL